MTAIDNLTQRLRQQYEEQAEKNLLELISPTTVEALELTSLEAKVLVALLLAGGNRSGAMEYAGVTTLKFEATVYSLLSRDLVEAAEDGFTFNGLVRTLRHQDPEEPSAEESSPKLILRPLVNRMILLARSGSTPIRGLAAVYAYIFGQEPTQRDWGILGLYVRELGLDRAARFFVEHAGDELQAPLQQLLPLARAIAKNITPTDGRRPQEELDMKARLLAQALKMRLQNYDRVRREGGDPSTLPGYADDMQLAMRLQLSQEAR